MRITIDKDGYYYADGVKLAIGTGTMPCKETMSTNTDTRTCFERFTQPIEREIATKLVDAILSAEAEGGLVNRRDVCDDRLFIRVYDGEDYFPAIGFAPERNLEAVKARLATTGSDCFYIEQSDGHVIGSILLIWGNGEDLISDYADNDLIESIVRSIEDL